MPMPVMEVRVMRMPVDEPFVPMFMGVRLGAVPIGVMRVAMVLVMNVPVRMDERLVRVQVLMTLRDVQPHAGSHQGRSGPEEGVGRFAEQPQRDRSAEERRNREIGASARGSATQDAVNAS